jgi:hypothetical protein
VQDAAASRPRRLLLGGLQPGGRPRILDACAAPGGKTAHLLELCDAEVLALDIDAQRCERIRQTLAAWGSVPRWWSAMPRSPTPGGTAACFDAILLDAPCTASGIVRRHPDVAWLRRETDVAQLAGRRRVCCARLWPLLRLAGGCCIAPVRCSPPRAARPDRNVSCTQHRRLLAAVTRPFAAPFAANGGASRTIRQGDHDGFFYALLEKRRGLACCCAAAGVPLGWLHRWRCPPAPSPPPKITQMRLERDAEGICCMPRCGVDLPPAVEDALDERRADGFRGRGRGHAPPLVLVRQGRGQRAAPHAPGLPAAHAALAAQCGLRADHANSLGMAEPEFRHAGRGHGRGAPPLGWKVADASVLDSGATHKVEFRFSLDLAQLAAAVPDRRVRPVRLDISASRHAADRPRGAPSEPARRRIRPGGLVPLLKHQSRALRWTVGVGLAAMTAIGLVLLFLLTQATNNRELYERNYAGCSAVNMVVAGLLLLVIGWIIAAPVVAPAAQALRQPAAAQAGRDLCAGRVCARHADLRGVLPVRVALDRELVRREGGGRARRRPEPGPGHAGDPDERPDQQGPPVATPQLSGVPMPLPRCRWSGCATSSAPATWCCSTAPDSRSPR